MLALQARPLSLWSPEEDSGKLAAARSTLAAAVVAPSTATAAAARPEEKTWWDEPRPPAYVHPSQKQQVRRGCHSRGPACLWIQPQSPAYWRSRQRSGTAKPEPPGRFTGLSQTAPSSTLHEFVPTRRCCMHLWSRSSELRSHAMSIVLWPQQILAYGKSPRGRTAGDRSPSEQLSWSLPAGAGAGQGDREVFGRPEGQWARLPAGAAG